MEANMNDPAKWGTRSGNDADPLPEDSTQGMAVLYSRLADGYARLWSPVIRPMAVPILHELPLHSAPCSGYGHGRRRADP
jgi:hypothetical protein